jgi:hypothetical protein
MQNQPREIATATVVGQEPDSSAAQPVSSVMQQMAAVGSTPVAQPTRVLQDVSPIFPVSSDGSNELETPSNVVLTTGNLSARTEVRRTEPEEEWKGSLGRRVRKQLVGTMKMLLLLFIAFGVGVTGVTLIANNHKTSGQPSTTIQVIDKSIPNTTGNGQAPNQKLTINYPTTITKDLTVNGVTKLQSLQINGPVSIQGSFSVNGTGTFANGLSAASFTGDGTNVTNVDAASLGGRPASFYTQLNNLTGTLDISRISPEVAVVNGNNSFSASNTFSGPSSYSGATTFSGTNTFSGSTSMASLLLAQPLAVSSGGTGVASVPIGGVLYGQGNDSLGIASAAGAGLCLVSTNTGVAFGSCLSATGIGVASLDGLTDVLTIANSTPNNLTGVITINDATTAGSKGVASFNATDFSVTGGLVTTIQPIATNSSPTFNGLTLTTALSVANGGTGAISAPGARTSLGAAASGANNDITGLTGLSSITPSGPLTIGATGQNLILQGGATTKLTATSSGNTTQLAFASPTANHTITLPNAGGTVAVAASGNIALDSLGNISFTGTLGVLNGGTGATSPSTARTSLSAAASGANADITSLSGLSTALTVLQGGTGATSLAANGILLGNGTSAITSIVAGSNGLCLISTAGGPAWQTCTGAGGVSSVNSQTGVLTVVGTADQILVDTTGTTITISAPQDIAVTSSPTFAALTLTTELSIANGGTGATSPSTARTSLSAAASGANADITSLTGLTSINNSGSLTVGNTGHSLTLQGSATSITNTSGGFSTSIGFASPTANVTYLFQSAAGGTYDICTTAGNCSGVGGGVTTAGGTTGTLALFSGSQAIGDSIVSQSGTTVTVGGTLSVNTVTPSATFLLGATTQGTTLQGTTVAIKSTSGANTNTLSFATPAGSSHTVTVPNATGTVAVSASGPLSINAAGNITCASCVTSGGGSGGASAVDSVNLLTGAIVLQGTTNQVAVTDGSGTITFSLPQDINTSSSPTFSSLTLDDSLGVTNGITAGSLGVTGAATAGSFNGLTLTANAVGFSAAGGTTSKTLTVSTNVTLDQNIATTSSPTFAGLTLGTALSVTNGGTGSGTFTSKGILYGNGSGALQVTSAGTSGQILQANGGGVPGFVTLSNDVTIAAGGAVTIATGAVDSGKIQDGTIADADLNTGTFTHVTGVGALTAGSIGSGFGAISTGNNITTTTTLQGATVNATTGVQTPSLDTIGSGALNIGSTNATAINLNRDTVVKGATDDASTFQVYSNYLGGALYTVDTLSGFINDNSTGIVGNLLPNASFESAQTGNYSSGWHFMDPSHQNIVNDPSNAHTGIQVLKIDGTVGAQAAYVAKPFAVSPGQVINFGGYIKSSAGASGSAGFFLTSYDGSWNQLSSAYTPGVGASTSYQLDQAEYTVPVGTFYILLGMNVGAASTGSWYFDDLNVHLASENSPFYLQNSVDSTSAFQVQNAARTTTVLSADTTHGRIGIGTGSPAYTLDVSGGAGIVGRFSGRVIGDDAVNNNEFTTLGQVGTLVSTGSGNANYIQNGTTAQTGNFNIQSVASTNVVAVIQGASSQTADLLQLQDSNSSILARFDQYGSLYANYGQFNAGAFATTTNTSVSVFVVQSPSNATAATAILRAGSSQTGDILQIKNVSGTVLSAFDANGQLTSYGTNTTLSNLAVPVITSPSTTGTSYYYAVTATNAQGETVISNVLAMNANTSVINWTQVNGANGYKVYRNTSNSFTSGSLLLTTITNGTIVSYTDTGSATAAGLPPTSVTGTKLSVTGWSGQNSNNLLEVNKADGTELFAVNGFGNASSTNFSTGQLQVGTGVVLSNANANTGIYAKAGFAANNLNAGDAVYISNTNNPTAVFGQLQFSQDATAHDPRVYGVASTSASTGNNAVIVTSGYTVVNVDTSAVAIGDQLVTTGTAGVVTVDNTATSGIIGHALSTKSSGSTGQVAVYVQTVSGQNSSKFQNSASASTPTINIQAASGQSGDLLQVQDSAGTVLSKFNSNGQLTVGQASGTAASALTVATASNSNGLMIANTSVPGRAWVMYPVTNGSNTDLRFYEYGSTSADRFTLQAGGNVGIGATSPGAKLEIDASASGIGQIIKANAITPGDLLQLQDSAGTNVISKFDSVGNLYVTPASNQTAIIGVKSTGGAGSELDLGSGGTYNASIGYSRAIAGALEFAVGGTTFGTPQASGKTALTLGSNGAALFQNNANSTTAFQIQNAAGTSNLLVADTTDNTIGIGKVPGTSYKLDVNAGATGGLRITNTNQSPYAFMINNATWGSTDSAGFGLWQSNNGEGFISNNNNAYAMVYDTAGKVGINIPSGVVNAQLQVDASSANTVGQIIQGAASQTADLAQFQNSIGTVLAKVDASGALTATNATFTGLLNCASLYSTSAGYVSCNTGTGATIPKITVSGHSYAAGVGVSSTNGVANYQNRYTTRLTDMLHSQEVNYSIGGAVAAWDNTSANSTGSAGNGGWAGVLQDITNGRTAAPYLPTTSVGVINYGINDVGKVGTGIVSAYQEAMRTIIARYRAGAVFEDNSGTVSYSGTWVTDSGCVSAANGIPDATAYCSGATIHKTTAANSVATISVPSDFTGGTIDLGFTAESTGSGATWSICVDNASCGSPVTENTVNAAASGFKTGMVKRLTGLTAGAHTIYVKDTSLTTQAYFDYWQIEAPSSPLLLVQNLARITNPSVYASHPATDANVATMNAALASVVTEFDSNVVTVDDDTALNDASANFATDGLHPNDQGHGLIAVANYNALQTNAASVPLTQLAVADNTNIVSGTYNATFRNNINSTGAFQIQGATGSTIFDVDTTNGRVGIGTTTPGSWLDILGNASGSQGLTVRDLATNGYTNISLKNDNTQIWSLGLGASAETTFNVANKLYVYDSSQGKMRLAVDTNGFVSLGTNAATGGVYTANQLLQVNGGNVSFGTSASTTTPNPAYFLYTNGTSGAYGTTNFGETLGYNSTTSRYNTLLFAASNGDVVLGSHVTGSAPTSVGDFTDSLVVRGDTGRVGVNSVAPGAQLQITPGTTSTVGVALRNIASQTADAFQVQDANGALLSGVNANGGLYTYGASSTFGSMAVPTISGTIPSSGGSLAPTTTYYYQITATNAQGETLGSSTVTGTTASTLKQITVSWSQIAGATGYKIYRNTSNSFISGSLLLTTITNGTTVSYLDTGTATTAGLPPTTTTGTGITIQGWKGQSGNIFSVFSGTAGSNALTINGAGNVAVNSGMFVQGNYSNTSSLGVLGFTGLATAAYIQNASTTPGDLLEFQANGGSILAKVDSSGNLQVASSLDRQTAGTLTIGGTTATAVALGQNTSVTGTLQVNGGASATSFQVLNGASQLLTVDASATRVVVGATSGCSGRFCINQALTTNGSTVTNLANILTVTGTATTNIVQGQTTTISDTSSGTNTINAQSITTTGTTNTADTINGLIISNPTANAGTLLKLQSGSTTVTSVSNTGATLFQNQTDSTTAFQIQSSGGSSILTADTTNQQVNVASSSVTTGSALSVVSSSANQTSGSAANITQNSTYTSNATLSGNALTVNRAPTINATTGTLAFDAAGSLASSYNVSGTPQSTPITIGTGNNRYLIADIVMTTSGTASVSSVAYNGVAMTLIGTFTSAAGTAHGFIYGLANPASGSHTISWTPTYTGSLSGPGLMSTASSWTNVDQTTPVSNFTSANGSSTSPSVTVTSVAGNTVVDWLIGPSSGTATAGGGQTVRAGIAPFETTSKAGASSTTMSYTISPTSDWGLGGFSLKQAASTALAVTGAAESISSNCLVTTGTCTDSSNVLNINQLFSAATGDVLSVNTVGTGNLLNLQNSGVSTFQVGSSGNVIFGNNAAHTISVAATASGAGNSLTISAGAGGGTNQNGGSLVLQAGTNTGSGTGGSVAVKAFSGQTSDLLQIQNSIGTVISKFDSGGSLMLGTPAGIANATLIVGASSNSNGIQIANSDLSGRSWSLYPITNGGNTDLRIWEYNGATQGDRLTLQAGGNVGIGSTTPGAQLQINASSASTIGQIIKSAASQSADLLQIQDSIGTPLAKITSNGSFVATYVTSNQGFYGNTGFTSGIGSIIQGVASQTGDLVQLWNSSGLTLSKFDANGSLTVGSTNASNTATAFQVLNSAGNSAVVVSTNNLTTGANAANATLKVGQDSVTGRSINAAGTINASGADYAEYFYQQTPGSLQPGQIACLVADQTAGACGANGIIVGAVSAHAGYVGNDIYDAAHPGNTAIVGMLGQLPVQVSVASGAIHAGDPIGLSGTIGVGAKQTTAGQIIGWAMADASSDGTINVLVRPQYYTPTSADNMQGGNAGVYNTLDVTGQANLGSLNVSGVTTLTSLTVTGNASIGGTLTVTGVATFGDIVVSGHFITAGNTPTATTTAALGLGALVSIDGNDTSGTITVTTGSTAPSAGEMASVAFAKAFGKTPRVIITPGDGTSAPLQVYPDQRASDHFSFGVTGTPVAHTTYTFEYFITQ